MWMIAAVGCGQQPTVCGGIADSTVALRHRWENPPLRTPRDEIGERPVSVFGAGRGSRGTTLRGSVE
ncbi:MAG: hypothetical protein QG608_883 [Actinomycetota bacterium]|nr:hypothetical protein [Actinomycetota bacterium]